jgi:hypothetical protein
MSAEASYLHRVLLAGCIMSAHGNTRAALCALAFQVAGFIIHESRADIKTPMHFSQSAKQDESGSELSCPNEPSIQPLQLVHIPG